MFTLTHKGYAIPLTNSFISTIKQDLTFTEAETTYNENRPKITIKCFWTSKHNIYVPRVYGINKFGLVEFNYPDAQQIPVERSRFNGSLRDYQLEIVDDINKILSNPAKRGGVLNLSTGSGKTCIALYIISKLRSKTIIVVHTKALMNQWKERIKQFIPDATVGIIQGPTFELENDIVIAMLQTLSRNYHKYTWNTFKHFECMIQDEVHHIPTQKFSLILHKLQCKYRLGLSATLRADVFQDIITYHIGPIIARYKNTIIDPEIRLYSTDVSFKVPLTYQNKINYSKFLNELSYHPERNDFLATIIVDIQKQFDNSRKMIVFTKRVLHATMIKDRILTLNSELDVGVYTGKMKKDEIEHALSRDIIIATYSIAKEGLDIPHLDTVVIAAPIGSQVRVDPETKKSTYGDIEQVVGRILRQKNHHVPLVIDVNDHRLYPIRKQYYQRMAFYKDKRYSISYEGPKSKSKICSIQTLQFMIE